MQVTALFTAAAVPVEFLLGLGLALVLQRETRLLRSIRALYLLPIMMAPVATGTIWRMMYNFDYGVVNYFLRFLGIPPQLWVSSASQSLLSTVIVDVWMWTPFMALVLLSGLQALDREPFEAAAVDGASSWQLFRNLTFPMMKPFILIAVTIRNLSSLR
jgi:multiple sugar transport system permease protein